MGQLVKNKDKLTEVQIKKEAIVDINNGSLLSAFHFHFN